MDMETRIIELAQLGYECSQILMIMSLELDDAEVPELVRAMSGLNGGMGRAGKACGCLSAGACVLGYYAGKGEDEELPDPRMQEYIQEYVHWFEDNIGATYGGTDCSNIIHGDYSLCMTTCMPVLAASMEKLMELLEEHNLLK